MSKLKRKIAILACLSSLVPTYSIAGVVHDQLRMFKDAGEDVVFITTDDFHEQEKVPEGIEIRYYPRYKGKLDEIDKAEFEQYVFEVSSILKIHLEDCTTCIEHDLLFIDSFLPINWAMRAVGDMLPKLKWLHWIHSAPSRRKNLEYPWSGNFMSMPNSNIIYLNHTDIPRIAAMFDCPENEIQIVHNMVDPSSLFKFHPVTKELINKHNLYDADFICVYPTRMVGAKQPDKAVKLLAHLRNLGYKVKFVICNSWSNADQEKDYISLLKQGPLQDDELIITSQFDSQWCKDNKHDIELGVPKDVVIDLMRISDIFILPSVSEACSMIMLEAGLCKNLMVLNEDLWSLHEFGGQKIEGQTSERALYMQFGSLTRKITNYLPSEEDWFHQHALLLERTLKQNQAINFFRNIRKRHNPKWVYLNQIKPLLR